MKNVLPMIAGFHSVAQCFFQASLKQRRHLEVFQMRRLLILAILPVLAGCSSSETGSENSDAALNTLCADVSGETLKSGLVAGIIVDAGGGDFKIDEQIWSRGKDPKAEQRKAALSIYCAKASATGARHVRLLGKQSGRLLAEVDNGTYKGAQ